MVVGAGIAGWSQVEALRALDRDVPITLVTACQGDVYHKPELSVALSRGLDAPALARESGADAARRLGVTLLANTFAVGLSPALKQLRTTRGTLTYRALVLAHGARPALPPVLPETLCWRINHLHGWAGLQAALEGGARRVAVVGAGMIGCELAEDLAHAGHAVTLIDQQEGPLANLLPAPAVRRLARHLADLGVTFLGGTRVAGVRAADGGRHITLEDGHRLHVDQVVAATGLVTEPRLARQAGLAFDRGIVVDGDTLATSQPGIHALGDCISIDGAPCRFIEPIPARRRPSPTICSGLPIPATATGRRWCVSRPGACPSCCAAPPTPTSPGRWSTTTTITWPCASSKTARPPPAWRWAGARRTPPDCLHPTFL